MSRKSVFSGAWVDILRPFFYRIRARESVRTFHGQVPADLAAARERLVLLVSCASVVALSTVAAVAWLVAPENLARGKMVSASSICALTPEAPLARHRLFRVVDGREREQGFAICTELEAKPWVTVDLGRARSVTRVVVYPRNDCCYGQLELPLSIEVSMDDQHFETVATSESPATPDFPWRFSIAPRQARYVRVFSFGKEARHVVIGELEVYGG